MWRRFTDHLDGELARRYGLITDFGKIADPIADKALTGAALVCLSVLGELPWWVTIVILGREIGITLLRFVVIRHGVIPASYGGKVKTVLQIAAIVLYILPGVPDPLRWVAMGAAVVVTVATGVDYVVRAVQLRQGGQASTRGVSMTQVAEVLALLVRQAGHAGRGRVADRRPHRRHDHLRSRGPPRRSGAGSSPTPPISSSALLGVPEDLLRREGAVHPEVAAAMAAGVARLCAATYGLAVTGVAGPEPQDGKPVGTVHVAVSGPDDEILAATAEPERVSRTYQDRDGG